MLVPIANIITAALNHLLIFFLKGFRDSEPEYIKTHIPSDFLFYLFSPKSLKMLLETIKVFSLKA